MACIINAESGTGLTNSADGSGLLKVQSDGKTTNALAWVNFTATGGTPTINASYNVSSLTDGGVGIFTVNFTTAMTDVNYAPVGYAKRNSDADSQQAMVSSGLSQAKSTTSIVLRTGTYNALIDSPDVGIAFFGN